MNQRLANKALTGALDAAISTSTSLISFRLDELTRNLTSGLGSSFWYVLEPLLMSRSAFQALTPDQQKVVRDVGLVLEDYAFDAAKRDDQELVRSYAAKGAKVHDLWVGSGGRARLNAVSVPLLL